MFVTHAASKAKACKRPSEIKRKEVIWTLHRAQELCESRGGRPGHPSRINLRFFVDAKQRFNINNMDSPESPGEVKSREVELHVLRKLDFFCFSRSSTVALRVLSL